MDIKEIFGLRLKCAREMKGLSMADLSQAMSGIVTRQSVYKYESGKMLPDSAVLIELCRILDVKPDYFFQPFTVSVDRLSFEYRKHMGVPKKKLHAIRRNVCDCLERYLEAENLSGRHAVKNDELDPTAEVEDFDGALKFACSLRNRWNLGCRGISNVVALLESRGFIIIEVDADEGFSGLSTRFQDRNIIVLNSNMRSSEMKRFTALHELGYLLMTFPDGLDDKSRENLCNAFANEMLIPLSSFVDMVGNISSDKISLGDLADVQREYGISIDALIMKAYRHGLISSARYRGYFISKRNENIRCFADRSRTSEEHPVSLERMVCDIYGKSIVSSSKAAALLNIPMQSLLESAVYV